MKGLPDFNPADRKWWPDKPDANFSPARNKRIVDETIQKYELTRARKLKEFKKQLAVRTDAAATYLTGQYGAQRSTPIMKYFGKRWLAKLRGEKIIDELKRVPSPSNLARRVLSGEGDYLGGAKKE